MRADDDVRAATNDDEEGRFDDDEEGRFDYDEEGRFEFDERFVSPRVLFPLPLVDGCMSIMLHASCRT